jgi:hypothetical protein
MAYEDRGAACRLRPDCLELWWVNAGPPILPVGGAYTVCRVR